MVCFQVNADGADPALTGIDLLRDDQNVDFSGNRGRQRALAKAYEYQLSGRQLGGTLGLLALPLGFVFGSAIASALRGTTTTTTTAAPVLSGAAVASGSGSSIP